MNINDFDFTYPKNLIAHQKSSTSRLLMFDRKTNDIATCKFEDFLQLLTPNDCVVFNDTKVIPARLSAIRETGGRVEIFIERIINDYEALVMLKSNKKIPTPLTLRLLADSNTSVSINPSDEPKLFKAQFDIQQPLHSYLNNHGLTPIPPYIKNDTPQNEQYQTIYAKNDGAVAAPTAGLHFKEHHIEGLQSQKAFVTLHVGLGTFNPVRTEDITQHHMHFERYEVTQSTNDVLNGIDRNKGKIIAIGTTATRTLETIYSQQKFNAGSGETNLFIYPGYTFQAIDALLTNFHTPKSTLFMLICAMIGIENAHRCYQKAIEEQFKLFSYGDAMLIL